MIGHSSISPLRKEDRRLLLGLATFVDDVHLDGMVHAVFVRSPLPHARIRSIDAEEAVNAGALLCLTAADLPFIDRGFVVRYWHPSIRGGLAKVLAQDTVRYVGDPVALVVARNRYEAEDIAALVHVDYEPLPALASTHAALAAAAAPLHHTWTGNVAAQFQHTVGDAAAALQTCDVVLTRRFAFGRQTPLPLETRGCVAAFDPGNATLIVHLSTQTHYNVRQNLSELLGLSEESVRVIARDVGGGFGSKSRVYGEEIVVSFASQRLGRPVKWIEDRLESMQATTHSRGIDTELTLGVGADGRVRALTGRSVVDIGGYVFTSGIITAEVSSAHCAGPYDIRNVTFDVVCVGTNKTPLATYRGAGQPEATFPLECMMDLAAQRLNIDAVEFRRRNLVQPSQMPYQLHIPYGGPKSALDGGDFPEMLSSLVTESGFTERVEQSAPDQRAAWGLALGIESSGLVNYESAAVRIVPSGEVLVRSGMTSQGQGQCTTYAQVCAETLGVPLERVTVRLGDTDLLPFGRGAFASRGAVVGANAVRDAALKLRNRLLAAAAMLLQCSQMDLNLVEGVVCKADVETTLSAGDLARAMLPMGALFSGAGAIEESHIHDTGQALTFAVSAHAARVNLNVRTGFFRVTDYVIAHDAGHMLNPMIVEGQIVGGAAEGIGGALLSEIIYDDQGQMLCGTLSDYLVATAPEIPRIRLIHCNTRAQTNPLGVRGIGEGGVIPAAPAIVNALVRAIGPARDVDLDALFTLPVTPEKVNRALSAARAARSAK